MKERTLRIAKSKVRHLYGRTYCGYLTPSEFLALLEAGIMPRDNDEAFAKMWKKKGRSDPSWFYFGLGRVTLDQ